MRLSRTESHDIVIQRHLVAARTRLRARNKGQLPVGPQTEIPVPKDGGDLAEKLEAVEDERQAVADEATPDLDLQVDVWRGRGAAVTGTPRGQRTPPDGASASRARGSGRGDPSGSIGWMQTCVAPASRCSRRRRARSFSSPQATSASMSRSLPPSARSSSPKPRRRRLFW